MDLAQKLLHIWTLLSGSFVCVDCANICKSVPVCFSTMSYPMVNYFVLNTKLHFLSRKPFTIRSREYLSNKIYWTALTFYLQLFEVHFLYSAFTLWPKLWFLSFFHFLSFFVNNEKKPINQRYCLFLALWLINTNNWIEQQQWIWHLWKG